MNTLPKISIVTPSYNQGKYLRETIKSVLNQNYPNLEYFVLDGGSMDNSVDIIREYDGRIDRWVSEKDSGQADAIGKGFKWATGDLLGWLNSDDAYFPKALEHVGRFFAKNPDSDLVIGNIAYVNEVGMVTKCYQYPKLYKWFAKRGITYFAQQGMFFKRNAYERIGGIHKSFHYLMDTELIFRMLFNDCKVSVLNEWCGFFRWHSGMKSINRGGRKKDEWQILTDEYNILLRQIRFSNAIYKIWQTLNGNYIVSILKTLNLKDKTINEIWGWEKRGKFKR